MAFTTVAEEDAESSPKGQQGLSKEGQGKGRGGKFPDLPLMPWNQ